MTIKKSLISKLLPRTKLAFEEYKEKRMKKKREKEKKYKIKTYIQRVFKGDLDIKLLTFIVLNY